MVLSLIVHGLLLVLAIDPPVARLRDAVRPPPPPQPPRFSNIFQSHMVIQRNRAIKVWGFGPGLHSSSLYVQLGGAPAVKAAVHPSAADGGTWSATLPPTDATINGNGITLKLLSADSVVQVLDDVAVGDLFLFSGQSNIDIESAYANQFNASAQIENEAFANATSALIRIMIVPRGSSTNPASEIGSAPNCKLCPPPFSTGTYVKCQCDALRWTRANGTNVRGFSATAWYTGKAVHLAGLAGAGVPIGLIRASEGGTPIQDWSSATAVLKCPQPPPLPQQQAAGGGSGLFNGMIAPLIGLQFKAVTWYQGESNTGPDGPAFSGPKYYSCALPVMVADWRLQLGQPSLPFLLVELSAYCNEHDERTFHTWCDQKTAVIKQVDYHLPSMRVAQASAEVLAHTAMVTAMDLGSLHPHDGSIHSAKKVELGRRLSLAAAATVYAGVKDGDSGVVWQAPKPVSAKAQNSTITANTTVATEITIQFTVVEGAGGLVLNSSAACPAVILPVFCTGGGFEVLPAGNNATSGWAPVASVSTDGASTVVLTLDTVVSIQRVRYAYADWPVCSLRNSVGGLPARVFDIHVV